MGMSRDRVTGGLVGVESTDLSSQAWRGLVVGGLDVATRLQGLGSTSLGDATVLGVLAANFSDRVFDERRWIAVFLGECGDSGVGLSVQALGEHAGELVGNGLLGEDPPFPRRRLTVKGIDVLRDGRAWRAATTAAWSLLGRTSTGKST